MALSRRQFIKGCTGTAAAAVCAGSLVACASQNEDEGAPKDPVQTRIDKMTVEQKAAQLFIVAPERLFNEEPIVQADGSFVSALQSKPVAGVIYFADNLKDSEQTISLLAATQDAAMSAKCPPLFQCVDEEGGIVQRIGGSEGFDLPSMDKALDVGATGDVEVAREHARKIAIALRDLGFSVDFAPSCDIAKSPDSSMYGRSFGAEAELVSSMVAAEVEGFSEEGILCCAKHFPGIGDPEEDSHDLSIFSNKTRQELKEQLEPFEAAIDVGVPFVMVGHLALPQITGSSIPASISRDIVQGILRDDLGYDGVVITDSLEMQALLEFCEPSDAAVAAIEAGCDIALMPSDFDAAYAGLVDAIKTGRLSEERIDQSLTRILSLKALAFPELFGA